MPMDYPDSTLVKVPEMADAKNDWIVAYEISKGKKKIKLIRVLLK